MKNVYNEKLKNFLHKLTSLILVSVNNNPYVDESQNNSEVIDLRKWRT
jgi:hypothetical protein